MTRIKDNPLITPTKAIEYYNKSYYIYFNYFRDIVISMFKWENTQDIKVPEGFIEQTLFDEGMLGFWEDYKLGIVCNPVAGKNENMYHEFEAYDCTAVSYTKYNIKKDDIVLVKNNIRCMPSLFICDYYAKRIAELEKDITINIGLQKFAIIGSCDEEQYLSYMNLIKQIDEGKPFIFKKRSMDIKGDLQLFNMKVPFIAGDLLTLREKYIKECFQHFGINFNPSEGKKERLLKDEVNSNNQQLTIANNSLLNFRTSACKEINKKFNLNLKVCYNNEVVTEDKEKEEPENKEV